MSKAYNCFSCNKEFGIFTWRHYCEECSKTFCSSCITEFDKKKTYEWYMLNSPIDKYKNSYLCKSCWNKHIEKFDKKYKYALQNYTSVESFSINYKGKIPKKKDSKVIELESDWNKNRDNSLKDIQITALTNNCNLIYNLEYTKDTDWESTGYKNEGTYYYTVWKALGKASIKN